MKRVLIALLAITMAMTSARIASAGGVSLGGGIHYLHNVGSIDENGVDLDQNSMGILGSIMGSASFLKLEGQVEYIHNYLGTDEGLWIPQAWALVGSTVYADGGIGIGHFHNEWMNDPFYALRAGVNLPLGPVGLDMY